MTPGSRVVVNDHDKSAPLEICVVICLIFIAIAVLGCLFSRIANTRSVSIDVATIIAAFALAISQSSAVLVSSVNGLATSRPSSSPVEKAFYASSILNIVTIITSKAAAALFIRSLIPYQNQRRFGLAFLGFLGLWGAASVIAAALQCDTPSPWRSAAPGVCINKDFWLSFDIISIVTDALLVAWALRIVAKLQMNVYRKFLVASCFASRLLVIAATATQIALQEQLDLLGDLNLNVFNVAVCMQVTQSLSVITACAPHLVTFFGSMVSGMLRADDIRRQRGSSIDGTHLPNTKRSQGGYRSSRATLKSLFKAPTIAQPPDLPPQALDTWRRPSDTRSKGEHSDSSQANIIMRATDIEVVAESGPHDGAHHHAVAPWESHERATEDMIAIAR